MGWPFYYCPTCWARWMWATADRRTKTVPRRFADVKLKHFADQGRDGNLKPAGITSVSTYRGTCTGGNPLHPEVRKCVMDSQAAHAAHALGGLNAVRAMIWERLRPRLPPDPW